MQTVTHNPSGDIYAADDWAHAIEVRDVSRTVSLSGTMGLHADGSPGANLEEQLELVWANIRRILKEADMTVDNIVRLTSYLRAGAFADANAQARLKPLGGRKIPTTAIIAETLSPDWLVEIEVIACA